MSIKMIVSIKFSQDERFSEYPSATILHWLSHFKRKGASAFLRNLMVKEKSHHPAWAMARLTATLMGFGYWVSLKGTGFSP